MRKLTISTILGIASLLTLVFANYFLFTSKKTKLEEILTEPATRRSFAIDIQTIGELEAKRSTTINSAIKGDLGKIIYIVQDGLSVKLNDILIKMDPTPFEEQVEELNRKIREQRSKVFLLDRFISSEKSQVAHEEKCAQIEVETAQLELNKLILGDGPIEISHLQSTLQKSFAKYNELKCFAEDINLLHAEDFLNPVELKQAENKLAEEKELYESAKMQYDSFIIHTHPMQIKKAEIALKRCVNNYEEMIKSGAFRIAKAKAQFDQSKQELDDLERQLKSAEQQMALTEIKAPSGGMVVLKEEFRSGQRRKPRLGDVLIKNQAILDLPDLSDMLVKTKVREIDLFKISVGTEATIEIDAYPELRFQGKILSIGVLAHSDAAKTGDEKYFDVILQLNASDSRLRPGMTSRILLHAHWVDDKIAIPIQSVFEFNKKYYCFIQLNNNYKAIPIEIGFCNDHWVEITSGLEEGLPILLSLPPWSSVENAFELLGKNQ